MAGLLPGTIAKLIDLQGCIMDEKFNFPLEKRGRVNGFIDDIEGLLDLDKEVKKKEKFLG